MILQKLSRLNVASPWQRPKEKSCILQVSFNSFVIFLTTFFIPFLLSGYLEWYAEEAKRIYGEVLVYHFGLPVSH
jgi:hypothetical protein